MSRTYALLLDRCVLEFRGADAIRFLNGQLSNDVKKLRLGHAMHACVMTAKGRMNAEVWLTLLTNSGIRLDGPAGLAEELLARFERYIISDDVSAEDVTGSLLLHHLTGDLTHCPAPANGVSSTRFHQPGYDLWLPPGETPEAWAAAEQLTLAQAEALRVEQGVPAWDRELDEATIPVEAGLDLDAIDYHKGCYIGQEIISRIKSVGRVNRHLVRLRAPQDFPLAEGAVLHADGAPVGAVTSCVPSLDLENRVALAYVKRAFSAPGTTLTSQPGGGDHYTVLNLYP